MAAIPVVIKGTISYQDDASASPVAKPVTINGVLGIAGLEIGGGPVIPDDKPPVTPPGQPEFPIWGPPGIELPPGSGYPPVAGHPLPTPPDTTPEPPEPIVGWKAQVVWTEDTGWAVIIVPKDTTEVPTPSKRRG